MNRKVRQGEIYTCELWGSIGSEEGKQRPCLIIQNDIGNKTSPTTIILPISSKRKEKRYPFHHYLYKEDYIFFDYDTNIVLCEQPRCVDLKRIVRYLGNISDKDYDEIFQKYCDNCKK